MQKMGAFLTSCAARLAPFERPRVGGTGCIVALAAMAAVAAALLAGLAEPRGIMAALRLVIGAGLASVIVLFIAYALVETIVERSVSRSLNEYIAGNGIEAETLLEALETRAGRLRGGTRLLALLKERTGTR